MARRFALLYLFDVAFPDALVPLSLVPPAPAADADDYARSEKSDDLSFSNVV